MTELRTTTCPACGRRVHDGLHCSVCGAALPVVPPGEHMAYPSGGEPTVEVEADPTATLDVPRDLSPTVQLQPVGPPTVDLPPPPIRPVRWGLVAVALLIGVIVGGLVAATRERAPAGRVIARLTLSPAGTTAAFDGGTIVAPRGAVATPTRVVVRRTTNDERMTLRPPGSRSQRSYAPGELALYSFEPADVRFGRPVTVTFRIASDDPGVAFVVDGDRVLFVPGRAEPDRRIVVVRTMDLGFAQAQPLTETDA